MRRRVLRTSSSPTLKLAKGAIHVRRLFGPIPPSDPPSTTPGDSGVTPARLAAVSVRYEVDAPVSKITWILTPFT